MKIAADANDVSSVGRAFTQLRDMIVGGNLPPGASIVEATLAERLGISRTPVRGALHWLQREGYVVAHAGARKTRIMVAPLTQDDARELYRIVGHLEMLAGREIAERAPSARTALADTLTSINNRLARTAKTDAVDPRTVFDTDKAFHSSIMETGGGSRLRALYGSVRPQVDRYWRLYASSMMNEISTSVAEHDDVVAAIRAGDTTGVQRALDRNWTGGYERISGLIEMFGERGTGRF